MLFALCIALLFSQDYVNSFKLSNSLKAAASVGFCASLVFSQGQLALAELIPAPWDTNVKYEIIKSGSDPEQAAKVGDLVTIRFRGKFKDVIFDDTFKTDEPYFYRCGVGSIVKGLDDAVVHMKAGDRYRLQFGKDLAFPEGRGSAPGPSTTLT